MKIVKNFKKTIDVPGEGIKSKNERIILPRKMKGLIDRVLISEKCLKSRIEELAKEISKGKKEIYAVCILNGAVVFFSDLVRKIPSNVKFDFIKVSSYLNDSSTGKMKVEMEAGERVKGKEVLLIEDIVDTGRTLVFLKNYLLKKGARSVKICALLDKPARRETEVKIDWLGFRIPNYFVIGCGLDFNQMGRNLPFVAIVKK
jgi:hypoxanthine phosphoribosyltransferase